MAAHECCAHRVLRVVLRQATAITIRNVSKESRGTVSLHASYLETDDGSSR